MSETINSTPATVSPSAPEKRYQIYRDGVLYAMFHGTRAKVSGHVIGLFNDNPSVDWEFELAA